MKYALMFFFTFYFGVSTAQRVEKISKDVLMNYFLEDFDFWRSNASINLSNSQQSIIKYTKLPEVKWSQTKITGKGISDILQPMEEVTIFDSLGNSKGKKKVLVDPFPVNFIAYSDNPELTNKVAFGYHVYLDKGDSVGYSLKYHLSTGESGYTITDHILFTDIKNWPNLKGKRETDFLKLLFIFLQSQKADSIINIKINNRNSKLHLFNLDDGYTLESFPVLKPLANFLWKVYEKDFATVYYSGKDSRYTNIGDKFGNFKMYGERINEKVNINEYINEVYDENGHPTRKGAPEESIHLSEICLQFGRPNANQNLRKIYPGASKHLITSGGIDLGNGTFYLSPSTLKRFSFNSQILIDYLIQIYN